jgi:hypothetical protein
VNILLIGDIVGRPGRRAVEGLLQDLQDRHRVDFTIVNAENAAAGLGLTEKIAHQLLDAGVDCITSGNHIWAQKEAQDFLPRIPRLLRPANYPPGAPGAGWGVYKSHTGQDVAVLNLLGRVFMDPLDCPFRGADAILAELPRVAAIVVDFHAEATSEKIAFGRYLDGRVTAVIGTHTHVQTADETVFPGGTAFLCDVGMTGPTNSVIGVLPEVSVQRFVSGLPARFQVPSRGPCVLSAVVIESDDKTGLARSINRLQEHLNSE